MKKITQILSISLLSCMMFASCTKTATDDASKFAGTWTGTSCGSASTFTLTKVNNTTSPRAGRLVTELVQRQ